MYIYTKIRSTKIFDKPYGKLKEEALHRSQRTTLALEEGTKLS